MRPSNDHHQRGFALLIVMMLVSLIGVSAAALLDLVNIDIGIAGEYRKGIEAEAASIGALLETIGANNFEDRVPNPDSNSLRTRLVTRQAGGYVLDPDGVVGVESVSDATSAYVSLFGSRFENGYESDVRLLRLVQKEDTSLDRLVAVYEVRALASVSGGDASRESRVLWYRNIDENASKVTTQRHGR